MLFTINSATHVISGTRGDSGTLTFQFNRDMDGATVVFVVKKDITTDDAEAYITKMVTFPTTDDIIAAGGGNPNNVVTVELAPSDTMNLPILYDEDDCETNSRNKYADYVWGLKVTKNGTYVETVIPTAGGIYPKFRLYYNINATLGPLPPATVTFYATTVNVDILTLQPGQVAGTPIVLTMASENGGTGKQTLNVPLVYGALATLYQYNTITSTWAEISTSTFTESPVTSSGISYRSYVHNGPTIASRQLTFNF